VTRVIRDFVPADLDAVAALSLRAWAPVFVSLEDVLRESGVWDRMYTDWRVDQEKAVRAACTDEDMRVWVAGPRVAGFVAARLDHAEKVGEIHMIAVDPAHQRAGIGGALTDVAVRWFTDSGMTLAMVETGGDPGHAPARRTYERAGFTVLPVARYFRAL
jgi:ribosomal protein S18 acetylase RimI-like enzyme